MTYDKCRTQQETKNMNETAILKALSEKPMRFKDLKETTGLSQMGLNTILKRLKNENKIEKTLYENHEAYSLTKKGQDYLKGMWMILNEIYEMQNVKTNYKSNYFSSSEIKWSLLTEVESPHIDYMEFIEKISNDYLTLILRDIKKNYLVKNEEQSNTITEPEKIRGKHIIAFEIDFDLMREYIEYSLEPNINDNKSKIGKYTSIPDEIKDHLKNQYRDILFNRDGDDRQ